jgi:serine/threonine-protein kinase
MDESQLQDNPLAERLAHILEGAYALEGEIGRGGMGVVFSARDLKLKRRVAIKVLPPDLAFRDEIKTRFIREAQTAARLSHPHIVPIHQVVDEGGLVCFVMGFVDGESLGARLKRRTKLPVEEVRRIMKETADALGLAHAMAIIHRDIKPDNILLEGTRRRVMVTDFGIAKALSEVGPGSLTGTGVAIGTPHYMSPEQAAGEREIDARSDLYALGVVAYEAVTGELPFQAPTVPGILMKQITEPAPDIKATRPEVPDELAASIMRCLEKDPGDRWPTADSLRRALESRKSVPYRPGRSQRRAPARTGRGLERPRDQRPDRHDDVERGLRPAEPAMVTKFRAEFASYVSTCGFLFLLNLATGLEAPWFLFPTAFWGFGIGKRYTKLWTSGYGWRDVINRPPAPDAYESTNPLPQRKVLPKGGKASAHARPASGELTSTGDDFGQHEEQIRQMRRDESAIRRIVEKLPSSERNLLPDVVQTVEALARKAQDLCRTLAAMEDVDTSAFDRLDERIEELEAQGDGTEHDRRLELLGRQRQALSELSTRRSEVEAQFEACVLAVQNVRFDLLRLRSAGVSAVLDDLTSATQAARALSYDVEAAIGAAGEIRRELGR